MLRTLPESRRPATRTPGSVAVSVVLHAGVVLGAAVATARGTPAPVAPPSDVIHYAPTPAPPEPAPRAAAPAPSAPAAPASAASPAPAEVPGLAVPPVDVSVGLPAVDLDARVTDPADFATGLGRRAPGPRSGDGPSGGEPLAGGAAAPWDAALVEEPVRPLAGAPRPRYPEPLRVAGVAGRVTVEFVVDTAGRAEPGSLLVREEAHPLLAAEVRRVLLATRYRPARVGGQAVRQRVVQAFEFDVR